MHDLEGDPRSWPPLGLPRGSVRALLTLIVLGVVVFDLARGHDLDVIWTETLLIALAHYFTTRRFVTLPTDVMRRLENEGVLEKEQQPLFLPRYSIRVLVLAAFVGLGVYLYRENRLFEPRALSLLGMASAYLIGMIGRNIGDLLGRCKIGGRSRLWGDLRALIVLIALIVVALAEVLNDTKLLPVGADRVALCLVLYYFGAR